MTDNAWLQRARDAYTSSTNYFDANIRPQIEADLRQFQGVHPSGSKYHSDTYKARSRLFRPKTRTSIRKNEAIAAAAFFSTQDVVNISPTDDNDKFQLASAEVNKALIQYRLTKTIPWFLTVIGAYQEAQTIGVVCSYQYWEYSSIKKIDKPCIELIPIENIRFDVGASWVDPINTSPYVIRMIPMYVKDIKSRMSVADDKTRQPRWKPLSDAEILSASKNKFDSIRQIRENKRGDSKDQNIALSDFSVAWVHENFIEIGGRDYVFFTLGVEHMLTDPVPIEEVYFHGRRPLVMGYSIIDAHKAYPSSVPRITRDVQAEINDIANQRLDNVKLALNKRYFVKRDAQVDIRSITRNVPAGVTLMKDPASDVRIVETNDVTASSYQEQDRLNLDFDDMSGSFSGASVSSNRRLNETVGGMNLLSSSANQVSEYQLRTFVETWVEPVIRQLLWLEQYYETDQAILTLAGEKAELYKKFEIDAITDELLMQDLTVNVNVGVGAVNPQTQIERFVFGMTSLRNVLGDQMMQQINVEEVTKELFGKLGYKDGQRFFNNQSEDEDPRIAELTNVINQLETALQQPDYALKIAEVEKTRAEIGRIEAQSVKEGVEGAYASMQAAEIVGNAPQIAPIADVIMQGAGYENQMGDDPNYPQISAPSEIQGQENTSPMLPPVSDSPYQGIETQELMDG